MPSRRDQIEMTASEIKAYLTQATRLILVSNGPFGYPHPMPMNFIIDEEDRYVVTTFRKSQKVENFKRAPKAALLVESGIAYSELKSVLAYAEAEIIYDEKVVLQTMEAMMVKKRGRAAANMDGALDVAHASAPKRAVIRFRETVFLQSLCTHSPGI